VVESTAPDGTVSRGVATGYLESLCNPLLCAGDAASNIDNESQLYGYSIYTMA
jgi:hypothetical protein